MKKSTLLKEYLRTCRRVKRRPSPDGFKKIEYLRFIGADACPACGEEVDTEVYICTRDKQGKIHERFRCVHCGTDFVFPQEQVH